MKKLYALFFAFGMLLAINVQGQNNNDPDVTVKIADKEAYANTNVLIPVYMDATDAPTDIEGVCSFEFGMSFNAGVLDFVGFHSATIDASEILEDNIDSGPGYLVFNWENNNANIIGDVTLFYIEFEYSGGSSPIAFDAGVGDIDAIEISRCDDAIPHNAEFIDGSISELIRPIPVSQWALFIGFGLIGIFIVIRAIRIF